MTNKELKEYSLMAIQASMARIATAADAIRNGNLNRSIENIELAIDHAKDAKAYLMREGEND